MAHSSMTSITYDFQWPAVDIIWRLKALGISNKGLVEAERINHLLIDTVHKNIHTKVR